MAEKKDSKTTTKKSSQKKKSQTKKQTERPLTQKEKAFCREFVKTGNGIKSVRDAGYNAKNDNTASSVASRLLRKDAVKLEIGRLNEKREQKAIMDANEVMELFSKIARGEVKDQFGLDASLNDRIKAMQEIAKRTIDIENRIKGVPDNTVTIKVDWQQ